MLKQGLHNYTFALLFITYFFPNCKWTFTLFANNFPDMQRVLLQLTVPKYLKKILDMRYGDSFKAKENTLFGLTVINTLKRKSEHDYQYHRNQYSEGNYRFKSSTEAYFINVSIDRVKRRGFAFDQRRAFQIVKALDKSIREELYISAILNKEKYGIEYQTTLLDFLDVYDIEEEELSYESLRKDFNRNRRKLTEKLKISA